MTCPICGGSGKHYPPCSDVPTNRRLSMTDDNATAEGVACAAYKMAEQQGLAQAAAQRQGANAVLGATAMDADWEAQLAKQERGFTRANALEKAMQSFIHGDHPSAEDIVARAKVFETYLLGDQS